MAYDWRAGTATSCCHACRERRRYGRLDCLSALRRLVESARGLMSKWIARWLCLRAGASIAVLQRECSSGSAPAGVLQREWRLRLLATPYSDCAKCFPSSG